MPFHLLMFVVVGATQTDRNKEIWGIFGSIVALVCGGPGDAV